MWSFQNLKRKKSVLTDRVPLYHRMHFLLKALWSQTLRYAIYSLVLWHIQVMLHCYMLRSEGLGVEIT